MMEIGGRPILRHIMKIYATTGSTTSSSASTTSTPQENRSSACVIIEGGWINGGFFLLSPAVIDLIPGDATTWEREPLEALARTYELRGSGSRWTRCASACCSRSSAARPGEVESVVGLLSSRWREREVNGLPIQRP
jgi:NDP-sugar pyrophosphorylase family protein